MTDLFSPRRKPRKNPDLEKTIAETEAAIREVFKRRIAEMKEQPND